MSTDCTGDTPRVPEFKEKCLVRANHYWHVCKVNVFPVIANIAFKYYINNKFLAEHRNIDKIS